MMRSSFTHSIGMQKIHNCNKDRNKKQMRYRLMKLKAQKVNENNNISQRKHNNKLQLMVHVRIYDKITNAKLLHKCIISDVIFKLFGEEGSETRITIK